jgi:hypothetical protein
LHEGFVGGCFIAQHGVQPGHAFISDHADLDAAIRGDRPDDRDQAAIDEIQMRDRRPRRIEDVARHERHSFERRPQQLEVGLQEHGQEAVAAVRRIQGIASREEDEAPALCRLRLGANHTPS